MSQSSIVGTAEEVVAVAEAGFGGLASGLTIFGFSLRKRTSLSFFVLAGNVTNFLLIDITIRKALGYGEPCIG